MSEPFITLAPQESDILNSTWQQATESPLWLKMKCHQHVIAGAFYKSLLVAHPEFIPLLPDQGRQANTLGGVLAVALRALTRIETIDKTLISLGKRHARIPEVQPVHYTYLAAMICLAMNVERELKSTAAQSYTIVFSMSPKVKSQYISCNLNFEYGLNAYGM
ncbi:hypothetical protein V1512DRAFT_293187 [Lipomyces arxii]|uniref:uncharacterized protein n=1 Tax=Lipomyces arxii TaxID=56418 RepID=UPI0034CE0B77